MDINKMLDHGVRQVDQASRAAGASRAQLDPVVVAKQISVLFSAVNRLRAATTPVEAEPTIN